jgi:hypothetical protein
MVLYNFYRNAVFVMMLFWWVLNPLLPLHSEVENLTPCLWKYSMSWERLPTA